MFSHNFYEYHYQFLPIYEGFLPISISTISIKYALFPAKSSSLGSLCSLVGRSLFLPFHWDLSNHSIFRSNSSESSWDSLWRGIFKVLQISLLYCFDLHSILYHVTGEFRISGFFCNQSRMIFSVG